MLITRTLLAALALEAAQVPRRRKNHNFHGSGAARANRMLNAMEPDSYVRPHRHMDAEKSETIIALRGSFGLVLFDTLGAVASRDVIACNGAALGFDIPYGTFHTLVALESGSVFFEAKAGPYMPLGATEIAAWAPTEGAPDAQAYLREMHTLFA